MVTIFSILIGTMSVGIVLLPVLIDLLIFVAIIRGIAKLFRRK